MRKNEKELEAAEAMILLYKNGLNTMPENQGVAYLESRNKKIYLLNGLHEMKINHTKLRFKYDSFNMSWTINTLRGDCTVDGQVLPEGEVVNAIDGSRITVGSTSLTLRYGIKPKRQQKSYQKLISDAIELSEEKRLTLSEIYTYFIEAGFEERDSSTWKNSIRHNLSLCKKFIKTGRKKGDPPGKGSYWSINRCYQYDSNSTNIDTLSSQVKKSESNYGFEKKKNGFVKQSIQGCGSLPLCDSANLECDTTYKSNATADSQSKVLNDQEVLFKNTKKRKCVADPFRKRPKTAFELINDSVFEDLEMEIHNQIQFLQDNENCVSFFDADEKVKRSMSVIELSEEFESLSLGEKTDTHGHYH